MSDDFWSRDYNKHCRMEYGKCEANVKKGIILDGEETGQKGSTQYPTDGKDRILEDTGEGARRLIEE